MSRVCSKKISKVFAMHFGERRKNKYTPGVIHHGCKVCNTMYEHSLCTLLSSDGGWSTSMVVGVIGWAGISTESVSCCSIHILAVY